jgi:hypothetical protein
MGKARLFRSASGNFMAARVVYMANAAFMTRSTMLQRFSRIMLALAVAASLIAGPLARTASASTGSTYTLIESALALIGGIILYNNYEHKRQAANTVVGYTRNGGTVYGDGRIVMPNGSVIYPGRNGRYPWGQYAYYSPYSSGYDYDYDRSGRYDRTHNHGYYASRWAHAHHRHHGDRDRDRDDDRDGDRD